MKKGKIINIGTFVAFAIFLTVSLIIGFKPGKDMADNFGKFALYMLELLPCAFILIGLFEVWVKREKIEKHFGVKSGVRGYIGAILLAGTTVGGLLVAFPFAYSLYNKGAKLSVIFTYMGAVAICRIPMTLFEATFMGVPFTVIRFTVSLPLLILVSIGMGAFFEKRGFTVMPGK